MKVCLKDWPVALLVPMCQGVESSLEEEGQGGMIWVQVRAQVLATLAQQAVVAAVQEVLWIVQGNAVVLESVSALLERPRLLRACEAEEIMSWHSGEWEITHLM